MRILIFGSGAVGLVLGGSLLQSGHDVVFLARGANLETMQRSGFRIEWPEDTWNFPAVRVIGENEDAGDFDAVLFCVKGYDWEKAAARLLRYSTLNVLTFQNGVIVHRELAAKIPARVLGSIIYVSADRVEPGRVVSKSLSRVILDGSQASRPITAPLADALQNDKLKAILSEDIELDLWRKYLFLCSFSALNTLTEKPIGPIMQEPTTRWVLENFLAEIVQIANAEGVKLSAADIRKTLEDAAKFPPNTTSSLFSDYSRKGPTETELLHGTLIRLAERHNVDAPVAKTAYSLLKLKTSL